MVLMRSKRSPNTVWTTNWAIFVSPNIEWAASHPSVGLPTQFNGTRIRCAVLPSLTDAQRRYTIHFQRQSTTVGLRKPVNNCIAQSMLSVLRGEGRHNTVQFQPCSHNCQLHLGTQRKVVAAEQQWKAWERGYPVSVPTIPMCLKFHIKMSACMKKCFYTRPKPRTGEGILFQDFRSGLRHMYIA